MVRVQPGEPRSTTRAPIQPDGALVSRPGQRESVGRARRTATRGGDTISRPSPSGTPRTAQRRPRPCADRWPRAIPSRNSRGSQFSQPRPSMYAACAFSDSTPASKVSVVSTPWAASGEPNAHTCRTPPHGSSPSSSCSGKTHLLPASRTASSTARPTAMWSAWLRLRPPQVSRKLPVITISGRWRRTSAARRRRIGTPYSRMPSGWRRKSTVSTPTMRADSTCSASRTAPALVGRHAVDAGLAAGDHRVADPLALTGPAGDRCGSAELHVVGVRHDAQGTLPGLVERFERWRHRSGVHAPKLRRGAEAGEPSVSAAG